MIGLMKKDFYNVGSSLKIYFLIPLLFAVLVIKMDLRIY